MSENSIETIINAKRAAIVAPAGCGKTETIVKAVAISPGTQLVLTHTHAGVDSLQNRFKKHQVNHEKYRVDTIAGFVTRYIEAYPVMSGWIEVKGEKNNWNYMYEAMSQLLVNSIIRKVIQRTYQGIYIDEYQDCTLRQHFVCDQLANIIPCRVFGDPLQGIFDFNDQIVQWDTHVFSSFDKLVELQTPWRWYKSTNEPDKRLGNWLLDCREHLLNGWPIDLQQAPRDSVTWVDSSKDGYLSLIRQCRLLLNVSGNVMVLLNQDKQCHSLARSLSGKYQSMEEMESRALKKYSKLLDDTTGQKRVCVIIDFAVECMTESTVLKKIREAFIEGKQYKLQKKYPQLLIHLEAVIAADSWSNVLAAIDGIAAYINGNIFRRELWSEMKRALLYAEQNQSTSLQESAEYVRGRTRLIGRYMHSHMMSRTLLIKGLEFDHVVIADAESMNKENLYVALTRPKHQLIILSKTPMLQPR